MNATSIIRRGLATFAIALPAFFLGPAPAAAQSCGCTATYGVQQSEVNWCAFACLDFVAAQLGMGIYSQCDFAGEAASYYYKPFLAPWCRNSQDACFTGDCDAYYLNGSEFDDAMNIMGFTQFDLSPIQWYLPPTNSAQLYNALCDYDLLIAATADLATGLGHAVVVTYYDQSTNKFTINNPNDNSPVRDVTFYELVHGTYPNAVGAMVAILRVGSFLPSFVGIDDIGGFWYIGQDYSGILLGWRLNYGTDPADSMAVYVADNPDGPARIVRTFKPLDSPPPEGGTTGTFSHHTLPNSACYYYWLDHGPGPFPAVRDPKILYGDALYRNLDNPVCYSSQYWTGPRDTLDVPQITQIVDPPSNNGEELFVYWQLSSDDTAVDYYNIYREEGGSSAGYHWIGAVPPGTTAFRDTTVFPGLSYKYRVSAAHHGLAGYPAGENRGIWNDFSDPVSGIAVNDFPTGATDVYRNNLAQNYPNPFNPTTMIGFSLARVADVTLAIYDVRGRLVKTLHNGQSQRGTYRMMWDGRNHDGVSVPSGVYFYRLTAGSFVSTKKMVLLR